MNVLAVPLGDDLAAFVVHRPPVGIAAVVPDPNEWADVRDLAGWCGTPLGPVAGYGELDVLRMAEATDGIALVWCQMCYPLGAP